MPGRTGLVRKNPAIADGWRAGEIRKKSDTVVGHELRITALLGQQQGLANSFSIARCTLWM